MSRENALLVKGFLLAHNPPNQIIDAVDAVIEDLANDRLNYGATVTVSLPDLKQDVARLNELSESALPKKRRAWSDASRAAAAERMRARQANGGLRKKKEDSPLGEA